MLFKSAIRTLRTELTVESLLTLRARDPDRRGEASGVVAPSARRLERGALALKKACIASGFTHFERSTYKQSAAVS
jgi:hypothetical protein